MEGNMGWVISAIVAMGTFLAWFTNVTIKTQLSDFKDAIRKEFGERFLDAGSTTQNLDRMKRDIENLDKMINKVEDYTHKSYHELRNDIQALKLKVPWKTREGE